MMSWKERSQLRSWFECMKIDFSTVLIGSLYFICYNKVLDTIYKNMSQWNKRVMNRCGNVSNKISKVHKGTKVPITEA